MAKKTNGPGLIPDIIGLVGEVAARNPWALPEMTHFWDAQDKLLNEAESFSHAWFARRHEAARAAQGLAREIATGGGSNPAKFLNAMASWQSGAVRRLSDDNRDWIAFCNRCAGHLAREEIAAGTETIDEAAKIARDIADTRHAMPL